MNISIRHIFLLSIWLITGVNSFSQYYVKFKGDSIAFENDSVVLALDNIISNNLNWEISKDSVTWESLNKTNDTLVIRIHDNSFYRAVLTEGTCYPIKSDVAFAGFKSIEVSDNSLIIDSTGGVYILPSGIKLVVPPNAVIENVTISLNLLDSINAELQIPFDADIGKVFCAAIQCEPTQFLKPIKISIPAPNIQHNDLPYVYWYDAGSGFWEKFTNELIFSEKMQVVEFSTDKLTSLRIQLLKNVFAFDNKIKEAKPEGDCKEGFIRAESSDHDSQGQIGSKECYVSSSNTRVTFLECPGSPVNTAKIQEIGKDCEPELNHRMDKDCLNFGESSTVNVSVTIGGMALKDQEIQFYNLPYGIRINKTSDLTNVNGQAQFIITCDIEKFSGIIQYKVNYKYYLEVMAVSDGVITENHQNYVQKGDVFNEFYLQSCRSINSITLFQPNGLMDVGDSLYSISCNCKDLLGNPIKCENIEYIVVEEYPEGNSGVVSLDAATGVVTAVKSGSVKIMARSGDIESNVIGFSVSYQGDVTMSKTINWNNYNSGCCCPMDMDQNQIKNCWIMSYSGSMHIKFYLGWDESKPSRAAFKGCETIMYTISEPSLCRSETFHNYIYTFGLWNTNSATADILLGTPFYIGFTYSQAPSDESCENPDVLNALNWPMNVFCTLTSPNTISITSVSFVPDGCVDKVRDGTGVLQ